MASVRTWTIFTDRVVFGSTESAGHLQITVDDQIVRLGKRSASELTFRIKKIKFCFKDSYPGCILMFSDGMKAVIPEGHPDNRMSLPQLRSAIEGRAGMNSSGNDIKQSSSTTPKHYRSIQVKSTALGSDRSINRTPAKPSQRLSRPPISSRRNGNNKRDAPSIEEYLDKLAQKTSLLEESRSASNVAATPLSPSIRGNCTVHEAGDGSARKKNSCVPMDSLQLPLDPEGSATKRLKTVSLGDSLRASRVNKPSPAASPQSTPAKLTKMPMIEHEVPITASRYPKSIAFFSLQKGMDVSDNSISRFQGIGNMGNSCYMNSVIQGLFGTAGIIPAILASVPIIESHEKMFPVISELVVLVRRQQQPNHGVLSAISLKKAVDLYYGSVFPLHEQHDAHEFLTALLDILSEELVHNKERSLAISTAASAAAPCSLSSLTPPNIQTPDVLQASSCENTITVKKRLRFDDNASDCEENIIPKRFRGADDTVVKEESTIDSVTRTVQSLKAKSSVCGLYTSVVRNHITCNSCGKSRIKEEEYRDFSLEMGEDWLANRNNSEIGALEDLMKSFFKTEKRELACEHCKDMDALATVSASISTLPDVLIIHMKRFIFNRETLDFQKCSAAVTFPLELDMSTFLDVKESSQPNITKYGLCSIVRHEGEGVRSGHYTCDKKDTDGTWNHCDDSTISQISQDSVLEDMTTPYLFFYSRW